jgi:myo-inositol-1(or 4)-monophosphatase
VDSSIKLIELVEEACRTSAIAIEHLYSTRPRAVLQDCPPGSRPEIVAFQKERDDARTVVTQADLASEKLIFDTFRGSIESAFLSEEAGDIARDAGLEYRVIIDPLDGSRNFVDGLFGLFGISVGVERHGQLVAGGIALPYFHALILAERGGGAFWKKYDRADTQFHSLVLSQSRAPKLLTDARICVSRGSREASVVTRWPLADIASRANEIMNLGSCVLGLAGIVLGHVDGLALPGQRYWDFAGGIPILKESGCVFGIWKNGWQHRGSESELQFADSESRFDLVAASTPDLFNDLISIVERSEAT